MEVDMKTNNDEKIEENLITVGQKRRRKKTNYKKINNTTRQKLIEMVNYYLTDFNLGLFK
jgi:hypothetical protein